MTLRPFATPRKFALLLTLAAGAAASPVLAAGASYSPTSAYAPYTVTVIVDGSPAPEYSARGRIYVEALKGRNFSLRLSNPTPERVAVALSVDGRNVIDAKRTTSLSAAKWILMPGQSADIPGWQVSGETSRRFFFTETRRSYAKWLGDTSNVGTIEAVFYREKRAVAAVPPHPRPWWDWQSRDESGAANGREQRPATSEPEAMREEGKDRPSSPALDAEKAQAPSAGASEMKQRASGNVAPAPSLKKESDSFAATGIGDRTAFQVQWTSFDEDPSPVSRVSLRYEFQTELVRLGVLPREDDLYARDRGRGFEREYAPDPYRGH